MKPVIRYLIIALLLIIPGEIFCQKILDYEYKPDNVRFDNFLIKGGEAIQESLSILLDSRGFLWSGTETGLYRFDGIRYVEYSVKRGENEGFKGFGVLSIFEDSEGTIWTGTSEALNRLDQEAGTFESYTPDPESDDEISNFIRAIREDTKGLLWILTRKDIFSFDKTEGKFTRFPVDSLSWYPPNYLFTYDAQCFVEDNDGNKWFTTNKGLYLFNDGEKTFRMVLPDSHNADIKGITRVNCVTIDYDQNLWIGTEGAGMLRWDKAAGRFEKTTAGLKGDRNQLFSIVKTILPDRSGNIWSFGNGSFSVYNPADKTTKNYILQYRHRTPYENPQSNVWIKQAFRHDDGTIWFLNCEAGLMFRFDPLTEKLSLYRTPTFMTFQCILDNTGSFWFACIRDNIFRMATAQVPYWTLEIPNSARTLFFHKDNVLEDDQGRTWFLFLDGVYISRKFDVRSSYLDRFVRFSNPELNTIPQRSFRDSRGNLWFSAPGGRIAKYYPEEDIVKEYTPTLLKGGVSNNIPMIKEDNTGNIWIADPLTGLFRIDGGDKEPVHMLDWKDRFSNGGYTGLMDCLIDSHGSFWLLTDEALLSISLPVLEITDYTNYGDGIFSVPGTNLRVAEDKDGNIWILNNRWGLYLFNRQDGSFSKVNVFNEDVNIQYYDLLADRMGRLWIAHNRGITIYDHADRNARLVRTPRLQYDVQSCQVKSGQIYYVNGRQLYVFDEHIQYNTTIPPVYITRILVNGIDYNKIKGKNDNVDSRARLDLSWSMNSVSFEFAALNYLEPEENQYRYFMQGIDNDTVNVGPGVTAEYKKLPPGKYRLWVTGSNNDGVWNPAGTSLDIRIRPPRYRSALAIVFYFLAVVASVMIYVRLRINHLLKDRIRLKAEIDKATAELEVKNHRLAETDRIKTQFFTDISHEIRTPLTLILGPLENIAGEEMLSSRMSAMIDMMKRNAQRLMHLVGQFLDISRLDAGKMKIILVKDDIVTCLRIFIYEFLSLAESRHIHYVADLPQKSCHTWFDRDKIEKIVSNLLSNAFKYTPSDGMVQCIVKIKKAGGDPGQQTLLINVRDTGPGIGREDQERIFDRFYRLEGHHESGGPGTGIGLSLVREFVTLLHGEIILTSTPGRGSDFSVTLPLGKDHLSDDEYIVRESREKECDKHSQEDLIMKRAALPLDNKGKNKMRILLVEDNEDLRNYMKDSLREEYLVLEASDGRLGLNTALTMMPDIIVTDVLMPGIDGIELCRLLKNDPHSSHIPVIILTARSTTDDKIEGLTSGADDYLVKPFNMSELKTRISNLLALRENLKKKYDRFHILDSGRELPGSVDEVFMRKIIEIINNNLRNFSFDVDLLHELAGMSKTHLHRKLKILIGLSPGALIRNMRLEKASELLLAGQDNITETANSVGISNPSNFSKSFKAYFGVSPKNYGKIKTNK